MVKVDRPVVRLCFVLDEVRFGIEMVTNSDDQHTIQELGHFDLLCISRGQITVLHIIYFVVYLIISKDNENCYFEVNDEKIHNLLIIVFC